MRIEEIVTEVIIENDGATREDAAAPGSVPEVDAGATVALVERIVQSDRRRTQRLEVDE